MEFLSEKCETVVVISPKPFVYWLWLSDFSFQGREETLPDIHFMLGRWNFPSLVFHHWSRSPADTTRHISYVKLTFRSPSRAALTSRRQWLPPRSNRLLPWRQLIRDGKTSDAQATSLIWVSGASLVTIEKIKLGYVALSIGPLSLRSKAIYSLTPRGFTASEHKRWKMLPTKFTVCHIIKS